ncbi:hypothetical protein SAMN04487976_101292 [Xaviernesmea oryzae]|nr:hypothetical protein SAMN04487976_101292 [Xaviernesmea oryzae]
MRGDLEKGAVIGIDTPNYAYHQIKAFRLSKLPYRKIVSAIARRGFGGASVFSGKSISSEVDLIAASRCFDENWYRERHAVTESGHAGAIRHYIAHAGDRRIAPHPLFDTSFYLAQNPNAEKSGLSPLGHYAAQGVLQNASPHPLFDPVWYRSQVGGAPAKANPFAHFLHHGARAGISPHPLFNPKFYLNQRASLQHAGLSALTHFVECGYREGLWPNAYFDVSWYLAKHAGHLEGRVNPLVHFITKADEEKLNPHPEIDLGHLGKQPVFAGLSRVEILRKILHDEQLQKAYPVSEPNDVYRINGLDAIPHPSGLTASEDDNRVDLFDEAFPLSNEDVLPPIEQDLVQIDIRSDASLVSFDVWDTLLRRDCHPDEIKLQSARALYLLAFPYLLPVFQDVRILLEARRVSENRSAPNDEFEYRFDDALQRWLAMTLVPGTPREVVEELILAMRTHEILSETRSTRPDASAVSTLASLKQTAVFASDFYLPSTFLKKLLNHHGMGHAFLQGFSSSDDYLTKRSGRMFDHITHAFGIEPEQLHHVGDNIEADQRVPTSKGITSCLYISASEETRKAWFGEAFHTWRNGDTSKHSKRIVRVIQDISRAVEPGEQMHLEKIGVQLAPIVFGYCLNILEDALRCGVEKVFFFTREGVFFREVFDQLVTANPFNIKPVSSELLEVSRRATFAASLESFSFGELMRLWNLYSVQSLKGLVSSLNLDPAIVAPLAEQHAIDMDVAIEHPWTDKRVAALFADQSFSSYVEGELASQRKRLEGYLQSKGFFDHPVQLVGDVGWRGTIQDNLAYVVPQVTTRGHYIGLFGFLNQQPENTAKFGYVFDVNRDVPMSVSDVGPLEMIFNVPGGSVVGYDQNGDIFRPLRTIFDDEEAVMADVRALQRGMLRALGPLADYVRLHGLSATDLTSVARDTLHALTMNPPLPIVDLFYRLHHNETFGLGEVKDMGAQSAGIAEFATLKGSDLHKALSDVLCKTRWPEASVQQKVLRDWWQTADADRRMAAPAEVTALHAPATVKIRGSNLSVFVPPPLIGSGGHRTIFNMVRRLSEFGMRPHIMLEGVGDGVGAVEEYLAGTSALLHMRWHNRAPSDVAFATVANSAAYVAELRHVPHKAYLVQDYESLFNPMSDGYIIGQNSYAKGLQHFTIGNWLSHIITTEYAAPSVAAGLGVDTAVYKRDKAIEREFAICFLYQPNKPRRTPLLGIEALRLLKKKHPDLTVYVYGSAVSIDLDFPVINLGMIRNLNDLNQLYNRCMVGLCISGSNPSRIPYEMMAAGCVPIDLYRYNNLLDYDDGVIALAYQDSASLAHAADQLLADKANLQRMSDNGITFAESRTLRWENDVIANGVIEMLEDRTPPVWKPDLHYTAAPIIAPTSARSSVIAFCAAQKEKSVYQLPHRNV